MTIRKLAVAALLAVVASPAIAQEDLGLAVTDPVARKECGACHVPYSPQFLPARSWRKIMSTLNDHFGEDASLSDKAHKTILDYLVTNASDVSRTRVARALARGIAPTDTPLRITRTPTWVAIHEEVAPHWWSDPRVKSKANCGACHRRAAQGFYGDED
jgi:cytochrome c551/c552